MIAEKLIMKQVAKNLTALAGAGACFISIDKNGITVTEEGKPPQQSQEIPKELDQLKGILSGMFSAEFKSLDVQVIDGGAFAYDLRYLDKNGNEISKKEKHDKD